MEQVGLATFAVENALMRYVLDQMRIICGGIGRTPMARAEIYHRISNWRYTEFADEKI